MPLVALVLIVVWLGLVAGARGMARYRSTATTGIIARDETGLAQWWSKRLSSLGFLLAVLAPLADLAGVPAIDALDRPPVHLTGVALAVLGITLTLVSQSAMGASWRGDVDAEARTPLVTSGPFRVVRNPILAGTLLIVGGLALLVPNVLSAGMVAVVVALQIQVRRVEEPHLLRVHGDAYRAYASKTGRFLPGIGRLPASPSADETSG